MPNISAVKMLDPAFSRQACSTPRAGQNTAQAALSESSWWAPSVKMAVLEVWRTGGPVQLGHVDAPLVCSPPLGLSTLETRECRRQEESMAEEI